jgi:hypothetical protein
VTAGHVARAQGILAAGFFPVDTAWGKRLYAMAFIEHGTRRLHITGVRAHPTAQWAVQQARNIAAVFTAQDTQVLLGVPRAPRMNAQCERVIGTIRREVLGHGLILGESHARKVLTDCQDRCNGHRAHRDPGSSYRPARPSSPQSCTTSTTEACLAPGSSAASSTSIDTLHDLQRRLFEPRRRGCL